MVRKKDIERQTMVLERNTSSIKVFFFMPVKTMPRMVGKNKLFHRETEGTGEGVKEQSNQHPHCIHAK